MDWDRLGLKNQIVAWLEGAATARYARSQRLDPFATSMRDFDDVSADLVRIRAGKEPSVTDRAQRQTDLRNAGLISGNRIALTDLGTATLKAWETYNVASSNKDDELARHLLLALEAARISESQYLEYFRYWQDLRTYFNGLALIARWDVLYALNYLDFPIDGFAPGLVYRDEAVPVKDIDFDLAGYAEKISAGERAIQGGQRVQKAIRDQIPRGRHRSTFCMALEIAITEGQNAFFILDRFGLPERPMEWSPFSDDQKEKIFKIIRNYDAELGVAADSEAVSSGQSADTASESAVYGTKKPAKLPDEIDFNAARLEPKPARLQTGADNERRRRSHKVDGIQKARANDATGKLGEDFAMRYEQWRLKDHQELLKKIKHVAKEDDTLGYDIQSFEVDGTPRFVEVKATLGPIESRFFMTANELACAEREGGRYIILRVAQLPNRPVYWEARFPFKGQLDLEIFNYIVTFTPHN